MLRNEPIDHLLLHPFRAAIVDHVRDRPGLSFMELLGRVPAAAGRSPTGNGTLAHHLRHLERARLLVSRRAGRHRRFYPIGSRIGDLGTVALVQRPRTLKVARLLAGGGGRTSDEIGFGVDPSRPWSRQVVSYHLRLLKEAGLVVGTRQGRTPRYEATPRLTALASRLSPDVESAFGVPVPDQSREDFVGVGQRGDHVHQIGPPRGTLNPEPSTSRIMRAPR